MSHFFPTALYRRPEIQNPPYSTLNRNNEGISRANVLVDVGTVKNFLPLLFLAGVID